MGGVPRLDEHRCSLDHLTVGQLDTPQAVVLHHQPCYLAIDPDSARPQLVPLGGGQFIGVDEEDDVVGPLPYQEGVLHRAGLGAERSYADSLCLDRRQLVNISLGWRSFISFRELRAAAPSGWICPGSRSPGPDASTPMLASALARSSTLP